MRSIWIFSHGYPTKDDPQMAFLKPLVNAWAEQGVQCTVIVPQSITNSFFRSRRRRPLKWKDMTEKGSTVDVIQPPVLTFGRYRLGDATASALIRTRALRKIFLQSRSKPDVIYAHFWHCGIEAASACKGIPVVVGNGESEIWAVSECGPRMVERWLPDIKGVISVAEKCRQESRECGLLRYEPKNIVIPNGYQSCEFYPMSRRDVRKSLGFDKTDQIAVFVGQFSERKGVLRVVAAVEKVPGLKLLLIGAGNQKPESDRILLAKCIPHAKLVQYLNAADFFVLPTLAEGCCNAIVEAMACGLPIISSDRSFNDDLLNETNSLRINPEDVNAIADAMQTLCDSPELRQKLSEGALATAAELQIEKRAEKILRFMEECIE